jgi:hypothetical protein
MNKEQQELLDESYKNYKKHYTKKYNGTDGLRLGQYPLNNSTIENLILSQEEFIDKCKTNPEFSERWGLKIEERELDMMERWKIADLTPNMMEFDYCNKLCDEHNVPTKLITITYNDKKIESYE